LRGVTSLCKWLLVGGEPAGEGSPGHHHATPRLGAAAWRGFHWSVYLHEKKASFSVQHMLYVPYKKGSPLAQE